MDWESSIGGFFNDSSISKIRLFFQFNWIICHVPNAIKTNIKKPIKLFTGKYRFELENGQVWESYTALARHQASPFKKNIKVEIEKSQMGSFWIIDISSGKRVKVKRII